jgi:hypothetical protein
LRRIAIGIALAAVALLAVVGGLFALTERNRAANETAMPPRPH